MDSETYFQKFHKKITHNYNCNQYLIAAMMEFEAMEKESVHDGEKAIFGFLKLELDHLIKSLTRNYEFDRDTLIEFMNGKTDVL